MNALHSSRSWLCHHWILTLPLDNSHSFVLMVDFLLLSTQFVWIRIFQANLYTRIKWVDRHKLYPNYPFMKKSTTIMCVCVWAESNSMEPVDVTESDHIKTFRPNWLPRLNRKKFIGQHLFLLPWILYSKKKPCLDCIRSRYCCYFVLVCIHYYWKSRGVENQNISAWFNCFVFCFSFFLLYMNLCSLPSMWNS